MRKMKDSSLFLDELIFQSIQNDKVTHMDECTI